MLCSYINKTDFSSLSNHLNMSIKILFIVKLLILAGILVMCNGEKNTDLPADDTTCLITDKGKLEEITIFPADNPLNQNISEALVDNRSNAIIALIGSAALKADFGSGNWEGSPIGIPFILVCDSQSKIPVIFRGNGYDDNYGDESDPGPYPVPLSAPVEGNGSGDSHVLAVDVDNRILYELYNASVGNGVWEASGGAVWDLKINDSRPPGWTSADAAGLPILPLLVRYDEIKKGTIDHAIRFTLSKSKVTHGYTAPASHMVRGSNTNPEAPAPMGMRLRLKPDYDISGFSETNRVILNGMKNYGIILADIGTDLFISGAPDERWDNDDLRQLGNVRANDFEVVQMGNIVGE
jgi:hypothetical protein